MTFYYFLFNIFINLDALLLTEKGKQHFGHDRKNGNGNGSGGNGSGSNDDNGNVGWLPILICGILVCFFILNKKQKKRQPLGNESPPPYGSWEPNYNPNAGSTSNNGKKNDK